jgi:hypothetical protein
MVMLEWVLGVFGIGFGGALGNGFQGSGEWVSLAFEDQVMQAS